VGAQAGRLQYLDVFKPDLTTVEERTAYSDGKEVKIRIPKVPARPKDKAGYTREMEESGLELVRLQVPPESYMGCRFYVRIPNPGSGSNGACPGTPNLLSG
jgi:hypothetical protein